MIKKTIAKVKELRQKPLLRSAAYGAATSGVNTSILLVGNGLYAYILGADQYGTLAIVMSFAQLMQLGNLGLGYGVTKLCREKPEQTRELLYAGSIISFIPIIVIALLYHFGGPTIIGFFARINGIKAEASDLLALSAFLSSLALINDFIGGILNGLGKIEAANNGSIISKSGAVILAMGLMCFPQFRNYSGPAIAACVTGVSAMVYQLWNVSKLAAPVSLRPIFPGWNYYRALFSSSGGVAIGGVASVLAFPFARLSIATVSGASQVALYDVLIKCSFAFRGLFELALRPFIREFAPSKESFAKRLALLKTADMWIKRIAPLFGVILLLGLSALIGIFRHRLKLDGTIGLSLSCGAAVSVAATASLLNIPSYFWLIANGKNGPVVLSHVLFAAAHILCGIFLVHYAGNLACLAFCLSFAVSSIAALLVLKAGASTSFRSTNDPVMTSLPEERNA
jgi:hypothetical protein